MLFCWSLTNRVNVLPLFWMEKERDLMINIQEARINRIDVENKLVFERGSRDPNSTFIWTGNIGVIAVDGMRDPGIRDLVIKELEVALKELFKKDVQITVCL